MMTWNHLSGWIDHGLKRARWPASRTARMVLILGLGLSIVGAYLVQSSHIVAANRHVETLRSDLLTLRRQNALRLESIAEATTAAKMMERARALDFVPAEMIEFVTLPFGLDDDTPTLRDVYANP
jgi:hypothetical protein